MRRAESSRKGGRSQPVRKGGQSKTTLSRAKNAAASRVAAAKKGGQVTRGKAPVRRVAGRRYPVDPFCPVHGMRLAGSEYFVTERPTQKRKAGLLGVKQCISTTITKFNFKRRLNSWLDDYVTDGCVEKYPALDAVVKALTPHFKYAIQQLDKVKTVTAEELAAPPPGPEPAPAPAPVAKGGMSRRGRQISAEEGMRRDLSDANLAKAFRAGGFLGIRTCISTTITRFNMKRRLQQLKDDYARDSCIVKYPQLQAIYDKLAPELTKGIAALTAVQFPSS